MKKRKVHTIILLNIVMFLLVVNFNAKTQVAVASSNVNVIQTYSRYEYNKQYEEKRKQQEAAAKKNKEAMTLAFLFAIVCFGGAIITLMLRKSNNQLVKRNEDDSKFIIKAKEMDSDFNEIEFRSIVDNTFKGLIDAALKRDTSLLPNTLSEALYDKEHHRILGLIGMNGRLSLDNLEMSKPIIIDVKSDDEEDVITTIVDLRASIYVRDLDSFKVISGNDIIKKHTYSSKFKKKSIEIDKMNDTCPNCSAPLALATNGKCVYCHSKVKRRKTNWQLDEYEECDVNKAKM